jgi:ribosome biogenesis GTPase
MSKLSKRQLQRITHFFREKEERAKGEAAKFDHRAAPGPGGGRESVVRIMAENVDQMAIVVSFVSPPLKTGLIDRFLVIAGVERVDPLIVFNKTDLLEDRGAGEETAALYRSLGYAVLLTSTASGEGVELLADFLRGRVSMLAGHSGVGKSSLLNALQAGVTDRVEVKEVSAATGKGRHTTTSVRLYRLGKDTTVFDLPGLKLASLYNIEPREIQSQFPEFAAVSHLCRFDDCLHLEEPDCAVKRGLEEGTVDRGRYESYLRMVRSPLAEL